MNLVVKMKFGSHLYGTNTPLSDTDYKAVYIPEARDIILQRVQGTIHTGRSKSEGERNVAGDVDTETFSLQQYFKLLTEGQTGALDMLFNPWPETASPLWGHIVRNREKLLTKKSAAFVGYCRHQANKYGIKGSRVSAAKNAMEMFGRYMEVHGTTIKVGDFWSGPDRELSPHTSIVTKTTTTKGYEERYFVCCDRMVGFKNTVKEAYNIFSRIYQMYGDRARMAETNLGIDWKALSHAVRVGNEALELLQTHHITFPLPNAPHILDIKQGKLPYKAVAEEIEGLLVEVENASLSSDLPDVADQEFIDDLVYRVYSHQVPWYNGRFD